MKNSLLRHPKITYQTEIPQKEITKTSQIQLHLSTKESYLSMTPKETYSKSQELSTKNPQIISVNTPSHNKKHNQRKPQTPQILYKKRNSFNIFKKKKIATEDNSSPSQTQSKPKHSNKYCLYCIMTHKNIKWKFMSKELISLLNHSSQVYVTLLVNQT